MINKKIFKMLMICNLHLSDTVMRWGRWYTFFVKKKMDELCVSGINSFVEYMTSIGTMNLLNNLMHKVCIREKLINCEQCKLNYTKLQNVCIWDSITVVYCNHISQLSSP